MPGFSQTQERILVTSLIVGGFSLPALACAIVIGRRRLRPVMWCGIASALAASAAWLIIVWFDSWMWQSDLGELFIKAAVTFTITACWPMHLGMLALLRLDKPPFRLARAATIGVATCLAAMLLPVVWWEIYEDWTGRAAAVLSILVACGTIVTPILALIELLGRRGTRESIPSRVRLEVVCPRCGAAQSLAAGGDRCGRCGLRIVIDVEEPRCVCGYLLYQLEGAACPECGRAIAPEQRWRGAASHAPAPAPETNQD
jgi:hypothetical protein